MAIYEVISVRLPAQTNLKTDFIVHFDDLLGI